MLSNSNIYVKYYIVHFTNNLSILKAINSYAKLKFHISLYLSLPLFLSLKKKENKQIKEIRSREFFLILRDFIFN